MRLSYIFNSFITSIEAINWKDPFKWFVSIIGAIMVYLFGGWDWYMWALVGFVIADLITGISAAYKEGNLDSKKLKRKKESNSDTTAELPCQCRTHRFDPWVGKIRWKRAWQST